MSLLDRQPDSPFAREGQHIADPETELYWLALTLIPGLGPRRGNQAIAAFGCIRAVFEASRKDLEASGLSGTLAQSIASGCTFDEAVDQQRRAKAFGASVIPASDPRYPPKLRDIFDPPLVLFARGNIDLLKAVAVGVVGTRRPSTYGKAVAEKLGRDLSELGISVSSGMARGIDTHAHRGALGGKGSTIAVFGSGVDVIYPAENKGLSEEIAARGLVLSEFPMGAPSYPQNFPIRNRVVSGISSGILVVEGAQYSGSAITARLAMEQNREVFAVPGNITARTSWGPNLLIKQGATLVQDATDVLYQLPTEDRVRIYNAMAGSPGNAEPAQESQDSREELGPSESRVLRNLRVDEGKILDQLLDELPEMSSSEVIAALFQLEMLGIVKQDAGQRYTKVWC